MCAAYLRKPGDLDLPEPKIEEIGLRLRFTIYLAKPQRIQTDEQKARSTAQVEAQVGTELRLESRLESRLASRIVLLLEQYPAGKAELARKLGHKTVSGELHKQVKRLFGLGWIEMTIPDKPNSRLQKYRLTDKGKRVLEDGDSEKK